MEGWEGEGRSAASDAVASSATFSCLTVVTLCLLSSQLRETSESNLRSGKEVTESNEFIHSHDLPFALFGLLLRQGLTM